MNNENHDEEMFDEMKIIKEGLLNNYKGIYSMIVRKFESNIKKMGVTIFAYVLADKLEIERDKVNLASIRSAWFRKNSTTRKNGSVKNYSPANEKKPNYTDIEMDKMEWH